MLSILVAGKPVEIPAEVAVESGEAIEAWLVANAGPHARAAIAGLPFEPAEVTVDDLPEALREVDSIDLLNRMQAWDTRTTAAACYERRIKEITPSADPEG